jgi:pimeloyl-ACP methyl ester carboxylesterase
VTEHRQWRAPYRPLRPATLGWQLLVVVLAEVLLFRSYGSFDSSFHWAAHFLVGLTAAALFLTAYLLVAAKAARGQLLVVLAFHLYAMFPDLLFRVGIPHSQWMNVFLGHIAVHYLPGHDRTWLVLAVLAYVGYAAVLSAWLRARDAEAATGLVPGIGIGGRAVVRPQRNPATTPLAHTHAGHAPGGPQLVLLHGLGATSAFWAPVANALAKRGETTLAPDLLGYGRSQRIGTRFRLDDQAEAVLALLRRHELARVRLVGHSYGCAVAVEVARRAPELVTDLTLISPPAFADAELARARLGGRSWLARRTLAGAPVASAACGLMCLFRNPLGHVAPRAEPGVPKDVARGSLQHSFPAYRDGLDTLFSFNPVPGWLTAPGVPTSLIVARQDESFPPADLTEMRGVESLQVLEHEGTHRLPLEHPEWLAEQLRTVLYPD